MGTRGTGGDAAVTFTYLQLGKEDETTEDRCYEPEHLPTLLEDEENVSLADILSLRDTCLTEEEVWAVFAECVRAVRSIGASHLFHTLCITPDTLAFNAHGNVCFMEQLSDDPEGSFVPPEFDMTGSTFEGHMYSLGCTLSAALEFVIEPELQPELGEEAMRLLEQMQREKPQERPLPQDVLSLAEARLSHTSSVSVCRKLSSLGRRVLSLESVAACQDGKEASWEARWQHPKTRCPLNRTSSPADGTDPGTNNTANGLSRQHMCGAWDSSLWTEDDAEESGEGGGDVVMALGDDELDYRSQSSSPVRRRAQQRLAGARGVLNRSCSMPDSNNPPPTLCPDISVHVTDLTEIGADERSAAAAAGKSAVAVWGESLRRFTRGVSCDSYDDSGRTGGGLSVLLDPGTRPCGEDSGYRARGAETWPCSEDSGYRARGPETLSCSEDSGGCPGESETRPCSEDSGECRRESETRTCSESEERSASESPCTSCRERGVDHDCADNDDQEGSLSSSLCSLNNHMTKSMLCLNEESQDEWISLRELLVLSGRRLTVNELWALCSTCLASLQTYIDFPTYICLDTVYVGCEGEVLFLKPKNIGSRDAFYLAPEYQEHGILTEKACVYAVAAILWATAKFSLSPHQKLAMPRKLKRLLLEMAKRTPIERPSFVMAKKICGDYLSRQGTNAEAVWSKLINKVHQPLSRWTDVGEENGLDTEPRPLSRWTDVGEENGLDTEPRPLSRWTDVGEEDGLDTERRPLGESEHINGGFMPMATESRLAPMPGPIPHSYAVREGLTLPEAFTSIATHFTPIILTNEEDSGEETPLSEAATEGAVHEFARSRGSQHNKHMQVTGLDFTAAHFEDPTTLTQPDTDSRAVRPDLPSHHHHGAVSTTSTSTASSDRTLVNSPLTSTASSDRTLVNSPLTPTASSDRTLVNSPLTSTASSDRTLVNSPLTPTASSDRTLVNSPLTSTASSDRTLVNSPLTSPDEAKQGPRVSHPPLSSAPLNGCSLVNNYLLRQDPATGHLTLVPVQIATPESIPGLELTLPLITSSVQGCCATHTGGNNGLSVDCVTVSLSPTTQQLLRSPLYFANGSSITHSRKPEHAVHLTHNGGGKDASPSELHRSNDVHPALQEVIDLLRGEFAFDGYLEDGTEDLAMGEYIFSLKDLQYQMFASVVKERFNGLYWEDDLLGVLHCLVNYSPSTLGSNEKPPSKGLQRAAAAATTTTAHSTATIWTGGNKVHLHRRLLDLNGNVHVVVPGRPTAAERARERRTEGQKPGGLNGKSEPYRCRNGEERSEENQNHVCPGVRRAASGELSGSGGVIMDRPAGVDDESPSEADDSLLGTERRRGGPRRGSHNEGQMSSSDRSEDMEDSDSLVSERLLTSPGSRSPGESAMGFGGGSPRSWTLAFYGEDCFSAEVIQYALNLGQHSETPCLDLKMQELQQQLTIETRNLRKTRNFYQKLIQQDRKNKGCESKLMSSKLKAQLEELISRVDFLESVKKYLEMLTVEQWGLDVSQLSSLAACGPGSLELRSSEDPAVLSFGTHKGKRTLQAGSPLGLMAYLYARNAALEGYVQHFLYTYRHFCTPEELLQFLMDRFISSSRAGPELSGDDAKVFHRSLALLEAWVMDCRLVDFTQPSGLLTTLENFLITQVAPLDSRGGVLLTSLHSSPSKTWRSHHGGESLISPDEADDSLSVQLLCGKSSVEDPGRKTFQWKISRVVEPKEKAFSIAAILPVPAYGSLADDHLTSGWRHRADERRPFGQSEYSAQRTAQQLTLLQQDVFHGCHPVHFLNSRTQGVNEKVLSINKNVSQQHVSPAEGNNLLVCEGTQRGDSHLQRLLTYADSVTNWISAEIVICDTLKTQVALLSKFLLIGKHCYEWRNFATAMQILGGLENVIVRQLPAWKHLPSKVCEILEELRAVQVFLKSDDLCLMGGEQARRRPTLPSAHILAMHIQQLEIGAYTLTTGAYKWTKLRSIAKVVSQVHAFQVAAYPYSPDGELQAYLRHRIASLSARDVHLLAADNDANFQQSTTERHARRIQDTLRRVKATFQ